MQRGKQGKFKERRKDRLKERKGTMRKLNIYLFNRKTKTTRTGTWKKQKKN